MGQNHTILAREEFMALANNNETSPSMGYPEGWFMIAFSNEIAPGQVVPIRYFGRELVMFRTESGVVQVLDAFCAHLGAHLGGGTVAGENISCPFHAWEYGTDGRCKAIVYSNMIPETAAVTSWPTRETSGLVVMWHSAVGNPPSWDPPSLEEVNDPAYVEHSRPRWINRGALEEIAENIFDTAHLQVVHGNAMGTAIPKVDINFDGRVARSRYENDLASVGGKSISTIDSYGLGLFVNRSSGSGSKAFWTTYTPIDRQTVDIRFLILAAASTPDDPTGEKSWRSANASVSEFEKDLPIWAAKIYRSKPLLCKGDGPIGRYRMWTHQFFPQMQPEAEAAE